MTWLDAIKESLKELGGKGSLEDIYKKVQEIGLKKQSIDECDTWQNTIRQTIYDHSSDSDSFRTGVDIFCHLGHGIWGLRDMLSTTQTNKHFGNKIVESQPKETENTEELSVLDKRPHLMPSLIAAINRIREYKKKTKRIFTWASKNWKAWIPLLISVLALVVAVYNTTISSQNSEIANNLSKLNFRPTIRLTTLFKSIGNIPPHLTITNVGPIDAVQVKIQMFSHRFLPKTGKIGITSRESDKEFFIAKLSPQEPNTIILYNTWLNVNARLAKPEQNNVIEIKIRYKRPQDLKEYDESAFYFVNPDGLWVREKSSSLNTEFYKTIKAAIFGRTLEDNPIYDEWEGDRLHPK